MKPRSWSILLAMAFALLFAAEALAQVAETSKNDGAAQNAKEKADGAKGPTMSGVVVDAEGKPIAGAVLTPRGDMHGNSGMSGPMERIALPAVANEKGEFEIEALMPLDSLDVEVRAKGFSTFLLRHITAGPRQKLVLERGATIVGRVVRDGQPVPRVAMTVTWTERTSNYFSGPWEALTDENGRFEIPNVTAQRDVYLYAKMSSLKGRGALPREFFTTGANGSTLDVGEIVGDLKVQPGYTVSGRVVLSDGRPVPQKSRVNLVRANSVDYQIVEIGADGEFEFSDVPRDECSMNVLGPPDAPMALFNAYHLSDRNRSLYPQRRSSLVGQIADDTVLKILLEPGLAVPERMPNTRDAVDKLVAETNRVRGEPLQGVALDAVEK
jgi:hypothetical protein